MNSHNTFWYPACSTPCTVLSFEPSLALPLSVQCKVLSGAAPASGKHAVGICMLAQARGQENSG
jgi:hypothetical protein